MQLQVMHQLLPLLMHDGGVPDVETLMTAPRVQGRLPSFRGLVANVKFASERPDVIMQRASLQRLCICLPVAWHLMAKSNS